MDWFGRKEGEWFRWTSASAIRNLNCRVIRPAIQYSITASRFGKATLQKMMATAITYNRCARLHKRRRMKTCLGSENNSRSVVTARKPEVRISRRKFHRDLRLAARATARLHHPAFALGVVQHVHQKQSLPLCHRGSNHKRTSIVIDIPRLRLFMKRLLLRI